MEPADRKIRSPLPLTVEELDRWFMIATNYRLRGDDYTSIETEKLLSFVAAARAHLEGGTRHLTPEEQLGMERALRDSGKPIAPPAPGEDIENTSLHGLQLPSPDNAMSYWDGEYWKASPDNACTCAMENSTFPCPIHSPDNAKLVERLRASDWGMGLGREAADALEALRDDRATENVLAEGHIEALRKELGECQVGWETGTKAIAENVALRKENERLRNIDENYFYGRGRISRQAKIDVLKAENKRLRGILYPPDGPPLDQEAVHLDGQIKTLLTENERLVKALAAACLVGCDAQAENERLIEANVKFSDQCAIHDATVNRLREALEKIALPDRMLGELLEPLSARIARAALKEKG